MLIPLLLAGTASAFYLPGSAPQDYHAGDPVNVFVNTLSPRMASRNRLEPSSARALVSHDYYDERFHFCQPAGGPVAQPESLGSILFGDRILSSPFDIKMMENSTCNALCTSTVPAEDAKWVNERIKEDYGVNLLIDGLPSSELRIDAKTGEEFLDAQGFALGEGENLNNHYDVFIQYHAKTADTFRVVGVQVNPRSVAGDCFSDTPFALSESRENSVPYTYSVQFVASDVPWGMRWDSYLHVFDPRIVSRPKPR
jgi:transmembrane 9 superfamily protein 2/4